MSNAKVVPIRPDVVSWRELQDLRISQTIFLGMKLGLEEKAQRIAARVRRGAVLEDWEDEFDLATLTVRKRKVG